MIEPLHLVALGGWLCLSFFLSGMEAGIQSLSRLRIRQWVRQGRPGARALSDYLQRPENFLWTILVGNTLANFGAVVLVFLDLRAALDGRPGWFWPLFLAFTGFLYLFCDLLPKTLFHRYPNRLSLHLVLPFRVVHLALAPLVAVAGWFARLLLAWTRGREFTGRLFGSRDELRAMMRHSGDALTSTERVLIDRVLDAQAATLARVTKPLAGAVTVEVDAPVAEVLALCRDHNLSRLPVWRGVGRARRVAGVVRVRDVLHAEPAGAGGTVAGFVRPALYLAEGLRVEEALRRMQRAGEQFAIVLGPDGRERGLVTLWDLLQLIFGEAPA